MNKELNQNLKRKSIRIAFPLLRAFIVIVGTWMSVGAYGFMDDYTVLQTFKSNGFDINTYLSSGRPISGFYSYLLFSSISSIQEFWLLHIVGVLTLVLLVESLAIYFSIYDKSKSRITFLVTFGVLFSPGFLLISTWIVMVANSIGLLPAIIAAYIIRKPGNKKLHGLFSTLLLTLSFLAYPPYATIFVALPCLAYVLNIRNQDSESRLRGITLQKLILKSLLIFTLTGSFSILIIKLIAAPFGPNQRLSIFGNLRDKVNFLFERAVPVSLDFFHPQWGFSMVGKIIFILLCVVPWIIKNQQSKLHVYVIILIGLLATMSPVIVTAENWASNRALGVAQFFVATMSVILVSNINLIKYKLHRGVLITAFFLYLSVLSFHNFNLLNDTMRKPQLKELELIRNAVTKLDLSKPIEVKASSWSDSISPWFVGDEFGIPSTCQSWVPVPLTKLILHEMDRKNRGEVLLVDTIKTSNSLAFSEILNSTKD
jgi:hypothetical protein